ncbi:alpha-amylase family glycosyl hydrolase [Endozoicomonas sp.]|uniref:alpha-amylase family glycosyl hydrolase n=1 Tax=Endozoicomonas sp. TaxID=1892382 RepID=UPI00383ABF38
MKTLLLALSLSALTTGCQTAPTIIPDAPPDNASEVTVLTAANNTETRLTCNRDDQESAACNLRIYQVMVESFIDADPNADFNTGYGTSHHRGDIAGITASLDYIQSLGFNAIWLTPVFHSVPLDSQDEWADRLDATGYFASNFFAIDPRFGTLEQARELVNEAHKRGLYVFFDGVFGHFKENAAVYPSPSGKTLSKTGQPQAGTGREARYPEDLAFFKEVATYWIKELKIDGWRLDQAYQVPVRYWSELRKAVQEASTSVTYTNRDGQAVNPLGYMVAEIWNSPGYISETGYGSNETPALLSAFDFPVRSALVQTFGSDKEGNHSRPASHLNSALKLSTAYPDHAMPNLMLGNHDFPRFGNLLQRARLGTPDNPEYWARHKAAFSFMAAYSGPVTLYYNEEIGASVPGFADKLPSHSCAVQGLCDDHAGRTSGRIEGLPSTVGAAVVVLNEDERNLKAYVSQLMSMRSRHPALYSGSRTPVFSDERVYIDRKDHGKDHVLYLVNSSKKPVTVNLHTAAIGSRGSLTSLLDDTRLNPDNGLYRIKLNGLESQFFAINQPSDIITVQQQETVVSDALASCNLPDVEGQGPLGKEMWIRGTYQTGDGFMATPDTHKFGYKGNNLYQVVVNESAKTAFTFKFASKNWSAEYAVSRSAAVKPGSIQAMSTAAGPGTESGIVIPSPGRYVYSFRINAPAGNHEMYIGQCRD